MTTSAIILAFVVAPTLVMKTHPMNERIINGMLLSAALRVLALLQPAGGNPTLICFTIFTLHGTKGYEGRITQNGLVEKSTERNVLPSNAFC